MDITGLMNILSWPSLLTSIGSIFVIMFSLMYIQELRKQRSKQKLNKQKFERGMEIGRIKSVVTR